MAITIWPSSTALRPIWALVLGSLTTRRGQTGNISFAGNPALVNVIGGDSRWSLAWSLMAGVAIQITGRTTLDLGYRSSDMGKAESAVFDNLGFTNPRVRIDDLAPTSSRSGCGSPSAAAIPAAQP